jgi:DNA polymerase-3 subunit gamma/tau
VSNFVVSARKYRPIRFDSVVGQQHVTNTLKNAIKSDHLAQAFLFCGPRGVGKTTCARILAKVLNCENPTSDTEPCDECTSCKAFNGNASLNIHELDAASNNSVEHIRALIEQVRFGPQGGKYKIYIIDEVHMLSQAAFNAFLKTLEEPPSYAIFILATTEKHKIIPTILSRCQIFDFNRIQIADMADHLRSICTQEGIEAEEDALNIIAQKADGALRDALSIYDRIVSFAGNNIKYVDVIENLNILDYDYYFKIVDAIVTEDMPALMLLFDQIQRKGFDGDIFINGLAEHLRNLLVCQRPETTNLLEVSGNIKERYIQQAALVPTSIILSALSLASDCDINYKMSRNKRLHVEMTLIKMAFIQKALENVSFPNGATTVPNEKKNTSEVASTLKEEETHEHSYHYSLEEDIEEAEAVEDSDAEDVEEEEYVPLIEDNEEEDEELEDTAPPLGTKTNGGGSFSERMKQKKMGNVLDRIHEEVQEEEERYEKIEALPWILENIQPLWDAHVDQMDSPSIEVLYRTAKLSVNDDKDVLGVVLQNNRGKDEILRDVALLASLREKFRKPKLRLETSVVEVPEEEIIKPKLKPQTDRDKYAYFLELNPLLMDFQKRFGLFPADYDPNKKKR